MNLNHITDLVFGRSCTKRGRPAARLPRRARLDVEILEGRIVPTSTTNFVSGGSSFFSTAAATGGYTPDQIRHAYGIDSISFGGITGNGSGQTIAIIDAYDDPNITSDLAQFDTAFGTSANGLNAQPVSSFFSKVNETGGGTLPLTGPTGLNSQLEEALDVEWAHTVAPAAKIILVECSINTFADEVINGGVSWARNQTGVSVISMSFGNLESIIQNTGTNEMTQLDPYFTTPSGHAGVTFVAAAGDNGSPGDYPALSPNVLAVGGTTLKLTGTNTISSETVWNDNPILTNRTGGGVSTIEPRPSYQNQQSIINLVGSFRGTPDVAFDADPLPGVVIYDSFDGSTSMPWTSAGGTSLGAPAWSGLIAIDDQLRANTGQGSLDGPSQTLPNIYNLPASNFNDITSGSNGTYSALTGYDLVTGRGTPTYPVKASTTSTLWVGTSSQNSSTTAIMITYGQPIILGANVYGINGIGQVPADGSLNFRKVITGGDAPVDMNPSGDIVALSATGTGVSNATYGFNTYSLNDLTPGTYQIFTYYPGTANFYGSISNTVTLTIQAAPATQTTSGLWVWTGPGNSSTTALTIVYGQIVNFSVNVTSLNGSTLYPPGSVGFRKGTPGQGDTPVDNNPSGDIVALAPTGTNGVSTATYFGQNTYTLSGLAPGQYQLFTYYAGGANFGYSVSNFVTLKVNPAPTIGGLWVWTGPGNSSTSMLTITYGQAVNFSVNITSVNGSTLNPTGTVGFRKGTPGQGDTPIDQNPNGDIVALAPSGTTSVSTATYGSNSYSLADLTPATYQLFVFYPGNADFGASVSNFVTLTVNPA